jgi:hypothetical protein
MQNIKTISANITYKFLILYICATFVRHVHLHLSTSVLVQNTHLQISRTPISSSHRIIVIIMITVVIIINIIICIYNNTISSLIIGRIIANIKYDSHKNQILNI